MKKVISLALSLAMIAAAFTGCGSPVSTQSGSSQPTQSTASEKISIQLGIWPESNLPNDVKMHQGFVKTFNATHPNVTVVPKFYKYAVDTFVPLAQSGKLPTVFDTWYTEPKKLIDNGYVAEISEELKDCGWGTADSISPLAKSLLTRGDKVYGVPRDGYALGLMLNMDLFRKAGLVNADGTAQYPKTWEELAVTAQKIKQKTGQAGFCLLAKDEAGGWHFSQIAWGFGATLCTVDNGKYTAHLNTPEAVAAMEYVKSLKWTYDCLTADPTKEDWGTGFAKLGSGAAAMYIGANDAVDKPTQVNKLPVKDLSLVPVPAGPKGQYSLAGGTPYMFAKNATKAQIEACLDYIEVMGKAPKATDATLSGIKTDAQNKVKAGVPVIPRFPAWTNTDLITAENKIIKENTNVDMKLYDDYYAAVQKDGNCRLEEPGDTQKMYKELTKVIQKCITDKNANVQQLMDTAQTNYQKILDTTLNKSK